MFSLWCSVDDPGLETARSGQGSEDYVRQAPYLALVRDSVRQLNNQWNGRRV